MKPKTDISLALTEPLLGSEELFRLERSHFTADKKPSKSYTICKIFLL